MRIWLGCEHGADQIVQTKTQSVPPLVPPWPGDLADHYDLTISLPAADHVAFTAFVHWLAAQAAANGLSFAVLHDGTVREAVRRLGEGELTIGFHLDYFALWHRPDDHYAQLAQTVADTGGRSVNPPGRSRLFTDKAAAHAELTRRGLGVPRTVVLRPWTPDRALTAAERASLRLDEPGARLYVKPANGFGGRGVVRAERADPDGLSVILTSARNLDRHESYLVQREVRCPHLECADFVRRPAYWRVLYCLGDLIPFWWSRQDGSGPSYRLVTREEIRCHRLRPVLAYAAALARLSGLAWFSTELCLSEGAERSRYGVRAPGGRVWPVVAVDYVNDQCDVDVQSRWPGGTPDVVVQHVAARFAEAAWLCRHASASAREVGRLRVAA
jgi:hypothetical protein